MNEVVSLLLDDYSTQFIGQLKEVNKDNIILSKVRKLMLIMSPRGPIATLSPIAQGCRTDYEPDIEFSKSKVLLTIKDTELARELKDQYMQTVSSIQLVSKTPSIITK